MPNMYPRPTDLHDFRTQLADMLESIKDELQVPQAMIDECRDLDNEGGGLAMKLVEGWQNVLETSEPDEPIADLVHDVVFDAIVNGWNDHANYMPGHHKKYPHPRENELAAAIADLINDGGRGPLWPTNSWPDARNPSPTNRWRPSGGQPG